MRILAIRGRNLASLARKFEVDLVGGDLGGAGIFAICGPVGAGKTTLLDALCLALFDRTPRLSGRGGVAVAEEGRPEGHWLQSHDPRTLLRRGAGDGQAEVDFTGRDGRRYRATWTVRRARRKADGRVQAQEMSLEDLDRGITVARANKSEVLGAIRARLGLDFEQFCRSVLLAQGEFAAFLRASADERANLLESLTGADIYRRLSIAAHDRRKQKKAAVDRLAQEVGAHKMLDEVVRKQLEDEARRLGEHLKLSEIAVDLARRYMTWYGHAAELRRKDDAARKELQDARIASDASEARRRRNQGLHRALPLVPRAEQVIERQRHVVGAIAEQGEADRAVEKARVNAELLLAEQRAALTALLAAEGLEVPPLVGEFARWEMALVRWHRADSQWRAVVEQIADGEARATDLEAALRRRVVETQVGHERAKDDLLAAEEAQEAPGLRGLSDLRRELLVARAELRQLFELLRAWQRSAAEATRAQREVADREREREQLIAGFEQLVTDSAESESVLRRRHEHCAQVRTRLELAAYRGHLVDGEPCPLCGSEQHPEPAHADDTELRAATAEAARAEEQFELARDAVRTREVQRTECERSLAAVRESSQRAIGAVERSHGRWREATSGQGETCEQQIEGATQWIEHRERELSAHEADAAQLGERIEVLHKASEDARAAERQADSAARLKRNLLEQYVRASESRDEAEHELEPALGGVSEWSSLLRGLGDEVVEVVRQTADRVARCREAEETKAAAQVQAQQRAASVARLQAEMASSKDAFEVEIERTGVRPAEVREAGELGADAIAAEAERLKDLELAAERARAVVRNCADMRQEHEQKQRPEIEEGDANQAFEDARAASSDLSEQLEQVRGQIKVDDIMRRQREEIAPRLRDAEVAFEVWATLDDLIGHSKGDAFAVFAQGLTLDLLLIEANRRLSELAQRYRLEKNRGRDMDFVVVDLDLGGARRGLQSLSGGETFLVSLALALALATLAAPRSRVETLFLDEGFGTLDAQNLESALGALDSLQASGCQIGIISHVEGIAERIGTVVDVVPEGGGQSRIRVRTG